MHTKKLTCIGYNLLRMANGAPLVNVAFELEGGGSFTLTLQSSEAAVFKVGEDYVLTIDPASKNAATVTTTPARG